MLMYSVFDCHGLWRGTTNDEETLAFIIAMVERESGVKAVVVEEEFDG